LAERYQKAQMDSLPTLPCQGNASRFDCKAISASFYKRQALLENMETIMGQAF